MNGKNGARKGKRLKGSTIIDVIFIILGVLYLVHFVATAPAANPYDNYDIDTYNCLDIALETQSWYSFNGFNTTLFIGCFNDTMCHAWLEFPNGKKIVGYSDQFDFKDVYTYEDYLREQA